MRYDIPPKEGFLPEIGTLIAAWEDGTREWLGELEEMSEDAIVWQPYPFAPSIGGLVMHMYRADIGWIMGFVGGEPRDADHPASVYAAELDVDAGHWPTPPRMPWAWYLELLHEGRERVFERIRSHPDPTQVHGEGERAVSFRWIVSHLLQHDSYHGGQIVMLHEMWKRHRNN